MRALAVALIVSTATARPSNLNDDCYEAIAIVGGASPNFGAMGPSWAGTALNAGALTDGGTFAPGATYQLANTGGGQYGLYASEGTGGERGWLGEEGGRVEARGGAASRRAGVRRGGGRAA